MFIQMCMHEEETAQGQQMGFLKAEKKRKRAHHKSLIFWWPLKSLFLKLGRIFLSKLMVIFTENKEKESGYRERRIIMTVIVSLSKKAGNKTCITSESKLL